MRAEVCCSDRWNDPRFGNLGPFCGDNENKWSEDRKHRVEDGWCFPFFLVSYLANVLCTSLVGAKQFQKVRSGLEHVKYIRVCLGILVCHGWVYINNSMKSSHFSKRIDTRIPIPIHCKTNLCSTYSRNRAGHRARSSRRLGWPSRWTGRESCPYYCDFKRGEKEVIVEKPSLLNVCSGRREGGSRKKTDGIITTNVTRAGKVK